MPKGDKELLKADPEDGTTPIANLLLEALAIAKLTGKEKGAVLYLWRVTYGWHVNGQRLKEREITLPTWAKVLLTDDAKASKILSGLVNKSILLRNYLGPGKSYSYSMNTRVAEWDKGCLNRQGLSDIVRQGLPLTTRVVLPKETTPPDTTLVSPKERLKKVLKKDSIYVRFDIFWRAYPKKKSKGQAEKVFEKINPDEQLLAIMLASIEQTAKSEDWQKEAGQYIPYPATWLNAKGWEDEVRKGGQSGTRQQSSQRIPARGEYTRPEDIGRR